MRDYAKILESYCVDVESGAAISCRTVKLAIKRYRLERERAAIDDSEYLFDEKKFLKVCIFIEKCCRHVKAEWAGRPYILAPPQVFMIANIFGLVHRETGYRKYRKMMYCVGRKAGKSLFASALMAYMTVADSEFGAESFSLATTESQAKLVYGACRMMIAGSPSLKKHASITAKLIMFADPPFYESFIRPLGSDSRDKDGLSPHFTCLDELHEWASFHQELYNKMETGGGSRRQPLMCQITTAGSEDSLIWKAQMGLCNRILDSVEDGELGPGETYFAFLAQIDEDDDPLDESCWPKANPLMS